MNKDQKLYFWWCTEILCGLVRVPVGCSAFFPLQFSDISYGSNIYKFFLKVYYKELTNLLYDTFKYMKW